MSEPTLKSLDNKISKIQKTLVTLKEVIATSGEWVESEVGKELRKEIKKASCQKNMYCDGDLDTYGGGRKKRTRKRRKSRRKSRRRKRRRKKRTKRRR